MTVPRLPVPRVAPEAGRALRTWLLLLAVLAGLAFAGFWAITSFGPDDATSSLGLDHGSVDALLALPGGQDFLAATTGEAICHVEVVTADGVSTLRSTVVATLSDTEPTALALAGETVIAGDWDGNLWLWSRAELLAKAPPFARIKPADDYEPVTAVAASPDGRFFAATHATYWALYLIRPGAPGADPPPGTVATAADLTVVRTRRYPDHEEYIDAVAWSPDGHTVAVGGDAGLELWTVDLDAAAARVDAAGAGGSLEASEAPKTLEAPETGTAPDPSATPDPKPRRFDMAVSALAFSPDGRWLAVTSVDHAPSLWRFDASTKTLSDQRELPRTRFLRSRFYEQGAQALAFHPRGDRLVVGFQDNSVHVYRIPDSGPPVEEKVYRGHAAPIASLAVAADGRLVLTGTAEALIKLWTLFPHPDG